MKKAYLFIVKNWKTSIVGAITAVLTYLLSIGRIDNNKYELILGLLISIGYILTKDGDKSISNNTLEQKSRTKSRRKNKKISDNK